ncbi:ABC transporter permease subunit [Arthrobacter sp. zg-Y1171]|uniref:ABC transporter permease subunit n=1 Tax=unclassified Arthrobacter TaxID=235627 RepID=UPI0021084133|nr:ABC transporter permease subunit [Arthrobacter sp. zg-Y1171]MCQ1946280.1 ABC transporter permease [Arthrobacter sp. zg-Y1116]MCQ1986221.1 ABC transporter permease [Arthrobacter sp. zg-Y844]MCQ1994040.1 ABC transporter permease [Arthrobacter sp. zg-Y1171]UWX81851.1 ABC transporter permease [Arthrobacter sp. zg-Y1171]
MSTATSTNKHGAPAPTGSGVNFGRVLKSEWIKVNTVPSTVILLAITVVVMVGLAALAAWQVVAVLDMISSASTPEEAMAFGDPKIYTDLVPEIPASGLFFGQLLIASLGVVLIASEWGTGMIRSTFSAVPKRIPALLAKALVIAVISFVIGAGAAFISFLVAQPILDSGDLSLSLDDNGVLASILNTGTCLALIAVFSMAIGTLLRNTAGGVVTAIGIIFVLPLVVQIVQGIADWIPDAARFLPSNAGTQLVTAGATAEGALTQLQGGLVLAAWAVVLLIAALIVTKRRDV